MAAFPPAARPPMWTPPSHCPGRSMSPALMDTLNCPSLRIRGISTGTMPGCRRIPGRFEFFQGTRIIRLINHERTTPNGIAATELKGRMDVAPALRADGGLPQGIAPQARRYNDGPALAENELFRPLCPISVINNEEEPGDQKNKLLVCCIWRKPGNLGIPIASTSPCGFFHAHFHLAWRHWVEQRRPRQRRRQSATCGLMPFAVCC